MSTDHLSDKKRFSVQVYNHNSFSVSSTKSIQVPRPARFREATTVHSPVDDLMDRTVLPVDDTRRNPRFPYMAQTQHADVGFGYIECRNNHSDSVEEPHTPVVPFKCAMKMSEVSGIVIQNPLSPTFREEEILEKREKMTDKEQAHDIIIKTRVRIAKVALRLTNFGCSLIVLAMISTTIHIFSVTKSLPAQNSLPAWAEGTKTWPQTVVLVVSCISLAFCLAIFYGYWRGGHRRAEKTAIYYTVFAVGFFIFSIVMWALAAGILQGARNGGNDKDIWGWSCVDGKRRELFSEKVDYALVCRLQSWSLICCCIEVVVETFTILIYGIIFYRYRSKRKLRRTMDIRDRARSDLYLAQLRLQSAPNTPGFGPQSPFHAVPVDTKLSRSSDLVNGRDQIDDVESRYVVPHEPETRFVEAGVGGVVKKPFVLQAPPFARSQPSSPETANSGQIPFGHGLTRSPAPPKNHLVGDERHVTSVPDAKGETVYEAVPIPDANHGPETGSR